LKKELKELELKSEEKIIKKNLISEELKKTKSRNQALDMFTSMSFSDSSLVFVSKLKIRIQREENYRKKIMS
jgi:hypothetical protein